RANAALAPNQWVLPSGCDARKTEFALLIAVGRLKLRALWRHHSALISRQALQIPLSSGSDVRIFGRVCEVCDFSQSGRATANDVWGNSSHLLRHRCQG